METECNVSKGTLCYLKLIRRKTLFRRGILLYGMRHTAGMRMAGEGRTWAVTGIWLPDGVKVQVGVDRRNGLAGKVRGSKAAAVGIPDTETVGMPLWDDRRQRNRRSGPDGHLIRYTAGFWTARVIAKEGNGIIFGCFLPDGI